MNSKYNYVIFVVAVWLVFTLFNVECTYEEGYKWPTIVISILIRNKEYSLPYFLTSLKKLDYPKDRLCLWIRSDHNEDISIIIVKKWLESVKSEYKLIDAVLDDKSSGRHPGEKGTADWNRQRFEHVIDLREEAMKFARNNWADYILMIDADSFIADPATLKQLVKKNLHVVGPMLISDGLYSNFWCAMTSNYYYERNEDYKPILYRENVGCFNVPMVHSAVLINLRTFSSDLFTYNPKKVKKYDGPEDDIITFAVSVNKSGDSIYVCNDDIYGFIPVPLEEDDELMDDYDQILNVKLEAISRGKKLEVEPLLANFVKYPVPDKVGFDEIYMINLLRRRERRLSMQDNFRELGLDVKIVDAVDGKTLTVEYMDELGLQFVQGYEDPYHKRPMKMGEIGCFLSHYLIWKEIVQKDFQKVIVLEDDIHFTGYFRRKLEIITAEMSQVDWDLVYLGRKILSSSSEEFVTDHLRRPSYSYWTLGYILSGRGARKLLRAQPLQHVLPVDEYLPIMFDQHPNNTWKQQFSRRNLVALSAHPLLIHPTHYTGQSGYISDTEDSVRIDDNVKSQLPIDVSFDEHLKTHLQIDRSDL